MQYTVEVRNALKFTYGNLKAKDHIGDLDINFDCDFYLHKTPVFL
jgi:hypothetical protein